MIVMRCESVEVIRNGAEEIGADDGGFVMVEFMLFFLIPM
jgi:hypothetical protein